MALLINIPATDAASYNVGSEKDLQFGFELNPDQIQVVGRTLVITVDGKQIFLNNFFAEDGTTHIESFQIDDGDFFSAPDFISAITGVEPTELETAADNTPAGGGGIVDTFTNGGGLLNGVDALGGNSGNPRVPLGGAPRGPQPLPTPADAPATGTGDEEAPGLLVDYTSDSLWLTLNQAHDGGSGGIDPTNETSFLYYMNRTYSTYEGGDGVDTLDLTDTPNGDALFLDDDLSFPGNDGPHIQSIEVINGGDGNDLIDLSSTNLTYGDVTINGEGGHDAIWANAGNDTLDGGAGSDTLVGGTGRDILTGGTGNDRLYGGEDNDLIHGGEGKDVVFGGDGNDVVFLGSGNDTYNSGQGYHDEVTLGAGADKVVINHSNVTDGWDDSLISILDFNSAEDELDLSSFKVMDVQSGDDYTALFIGESVTANNTWVILHGVDTSDLANIVDSANYATPSTPVPDPSEYILQHTQETDFF